MSGGVVGEGQSPTMPISILVDRIRMQTSNSPRVSVLMPARNCIFSIESAIASILNQTFVDFEFIIIDDGSTDGTFEKLVDLAKQDPRIRIFQNLGPYGVANALNLGLKHCRGAYVARHDADDLSLPQRLEFQVKYMDSYPEIDIIGSWIEMIDVNGGSLGVHRQPLTPAAVRFHMLFGTPFAHPSVLIRFQALEVLPFLYREMPAQDYDLWARMMDAGLRGANLPDVLLRYRVYAFSDSHVRAKEHTKAANHISFVQMTKSFFGKIEYDLLLKDRCKQIAHALICDSSYDFSPGDELLGDAIIDLARSIPDFPSVSKDEMDVLRRDLEARWYPIRAKLAVQTQLARRPNRFVRVLKVTSRYFLPRSASLSVAQKAKFIEQVPIIINTRDRVTVLRQLLSWLQHAGHHRIILLDNGSTYPPLCEFLDNYKGHVIRLGRNLAHTALWEVSDLTDIVSKEWFVYTDPDVIPVEGTPSDAVAYFYELLQKYPRYQKAGFGLKINDLPNHFKMKEHVIKWESQHYLNEIAPSVFEADIDTTFALYRPGTPYCYGPALRTRGIYEARHMPWYMDSEHPTEEEAYYREHALQNVTTWSGDHSSVVSLFGGSDA